MSARQAQEWCQRHNDVPYFETSVKRGINVDEAFEALVRTVLAREKDKKPTFDPYQVGALDLGTSGGGLMNGDFSLLAYPSKYCNAC